LFSATGKATGPILLTSMEIVPYLPIKGSSKARIVSPVKKGHLQVSLPT
jgi:hypothetical protein